MICNPNYLSDPLAKNVTYKQVRRRFSSFGLDVKDIWFTHHEGFSGMGHLYSEPRLINVPLPPLNRLL